MDDAPPNVACEYWGWAHPPDGIVMGMYGLDNNRANCRERLCFWYGISKEHSKLVTDHLDKYDDCWHMHDALRKLQKRRGSHE